MSDVKNKLQVLAILTTIHSSVFRTHDLLGTHRAIAKSDDFTFLAVQTVPVDIIQ